MTQCTLNRAVARMTGESLSTIRSRGFSLVECGKSNRAFVAVRPPSVVDWDEVDAKRAALLPRRAGG